MKFKNLISFLLSVIIAVSGCIFVFAETESVDITESTEETQENNSEYTDNVAEELTEEDNADPESDDNPYDEFVINNITDYKKMLVKLERPTITTEQFFKIIKFINFPYKILTGTAFMPEEHFNVTVDAFIHSLSEQVLNESGLDVETIFTNLPDINVIAELAVNTLNIDTVEFRNQMYAKRDELWAEGDETTATLYHFLGAYLSIIEKMELYAVPTNDPDIYEIKARYTYRDGGTEELRPGFYINIATGECTNKNNSGVMGSGFNFSLTDMMVYATSDAWMRDFGFCLFYDLAAGSMPLLWNYNTRRFKFDYNGLDWMVQIWKGNYLIANGAEVGLYNKASDTFGTFYECATDEQMIPMSMQLYAGDELIVNQEEQLHWWINGFRINGVHYPISSMTLIFTLTMPDEEMLQAFCESIDNNYRHDVNYMTDGLKVTVAW